MKTEQLKQIIEEAFLAGSNYQSEVDDVGIYAGSYNEALSTVTTAIIKSIPETREPEALLKRAADMLQDQEEGDYNNALAMEIYAYLDSHK
jgi:hypothetical protein